MSETRREKFNRLATYRTNAVLDKIRILGNLSNRSNYDCDESDVKKIFGAIEEQVRLLKARFMSKKRKEFKL